MCTFVMIITRGYGYSLTLESFVCLFFQFNPLAGIIQFGKIIFRSNCRPFVPVYLLFYFQWTRSVEFAKRIKIKIGILLVCL